MKRATDHPPTPEQIAKECRQIRAHRAAMRKPVPDDETDWDNDNWDDDDEE